MSFEWLGTFTKSQYDRFAAYARAQIQLIDGRITHLKAEKARIGSLGFAFDAGGVPTNIASDPPQTYCGKLFGAYEALGGDAEYDLQVRTMSQPVYQVATDETRESQMMSNGEVIGTAGLADAESAELMHQARGWLKGDLTYRKDYLERKIRRALDYADQIQEEIDELTAMKAEATAAGSLGFILGSIEALITDRSYMAASNDSAHPDPHGKMAKAPFAAYEPGGGGKGADSESYQRTLDGPVVPGGSSS